MSEDSITHQLVIHIGTHPITFASKEAFAEYVREQREQGGINKGTGRPNWEKFEHLPLLQVVDDITGVTFSFKDFDDLPESGQSIASAVEKGSALKVDNSSEEAPQEARKLIIIK